MDSSDNEEQQNTLRPSEYQQNLDSHEETNQESPPPLSYPTLDAIIKEVDLLDNDIEQHLYQKHTSEFNPDNINIARTVNPSLLDLESLDLIDSNVNLLDISDGTSNTDYARFLEGREIIINQATEVIQEGYVTSYKLYTIRSKGKASQEDTQVRRRFSDFEFLQSQLLEMYAGHIIPVLPEKNFWASVNMQGKQYSAYRKKRLKKFLDSLLINQKLRMTTPLRLFLFDSTIEFAEIKGQFQEKTKIQDRVKMLAGRVYQVGKDFMWNLVSKKTVTEAKPNWAQHLSKDNFQITEYCLKLKSLHQAVFKLKKQVEYRAREQHLLNQIGHFLQIQKPHDQNSKHQLLQSFEDAQYYVLSCWEALQRHGQLHIELQGLKTGQEALQRKQLNNPRSKEMDSVRTKIKRLTEKLERSSFTLQDEMKRGVHRAQFLCKTFVEVYFKYRRNDHSSSL